MAAASDTVPGELGRRTFVDRLLGLWAIGVAASILYPILRYLVPPDIPEAATRSVHAGKASTLLPSFGRVVPFGSAPAIVIRTPTGEYRAFSAVCTHLSCTVQYRPDLQHIWCACHNGHYDLFGRNIAGPPPRPLEPYDVKISDDEIVVSKRA
jgi:nitrite reductase/ring-hydroxylating ferredoxin subunit